MLIPSLPPGGGSYRARTQCTTGYQHHRVLTLHFSLPPFHFTHYYDPSGSNGSGPEAYSRLYLSG